MTKDEIEIVRCALVQLLMKTEKEKKEIEGVIKKIDLFEKEKEIEVIE